MRAHPVFGDSLIAGLLLIADFSAFAAAEEVSPGALIVVGLLLVVPLAFRRKYPLATGYVILFGGFLQLMTHGGLDDGLPVRAGDFALAVALYTVVAYVGKQQALLYTTALFVGTIIWAIWRIGDPSAAVILTFLVTVLFGFSWALG